MEGRAVDEDVLHLRGVLDVRDGATVQIIGTLDCSGGAAGVGHAVINVSGTGSRLAISGLRAENTLDFSICDGATVSTNGTVDLGQWCQTSQHVNVTGPGSIWQIAGDLQLAYSSPGSTELDILNGATITCDNLRLYATGSVTVSGPGSQFSIAKNVTMRGQLTVEPGAVVAAQGTTVVSAGIVQLVGGTLRTNNLELTGGIFDFSSGVLETGTFKGALVNNGGVMKVGPITGSPGLTTGGTVRVPASYTQAAGTLEIGIAPPLTEGAAPTHDQLLVYGDVSLAGGLDLTILPGYEGTVGESFDIITATTLAGQFQAVSGRHIGAGKYLEVGYSDTAVTLTVQQALLGDFTGDGAVNALDIHGFVQALVTGGQFNPAPGVYGEVAGDLNSDRSVNFLDVAGFVERLTGAGGSSARGVGESAMNPEPGGAAAAGLLLVFLSRRR